MPNNIVLNITYVLVLLLLGYFFGRRAESRHFKDIIRRESRLLQLPTVNGKQPVGDIEVSDYTLVRGSVVISVDYFKRMLAGLRAFFGGEMQAYETLLDRARREAVLRMKESCPEAVQIINLRIETSSIYRGAQSVGSVEVLAYGTALFAAQSAAPAGNTPFVARTLPKPSSAARPFRSGPTG